ncbi:GNAT family N-acetyltransferase [Vallicoccus soli]|uniref:GNAT family N-acetyltransferase n=1 Tax=Vallicoccus soli TaxID=2339232 RepID=UPI001402B0E8|nr:GNAT family N-acetyltransferase [Vallicoccus soli]
MTTTWQVRGLGPDEVRAFLAVDELGFHLSRSPEDEAVELSLLEQDRTLVAVDPAAPRDLAGVAATYSHVMTLPGGPAPVAGLTWVSVHPAARRRGVLSALMRHHLHGLHGEGREPVAALWASEAAIYGRFGYGAASRQVGLTVPRGPRALVPAPDDPALRVRLAGDDEPLERLERVYDAERLRRPGVHARDERWRRAALFVPPPERAGRTPLRTVVVEDGAGARAYGRYQVEPRWSAAGADGVVHVREAFATDPAAYAALWRFLCDLDLTASVHVRPRPTDDPLLDLLVDVRGAQPTLGDALYVRLVDLERALPARAYAGEVDLVLEVADPLCPWNAGRWRLAAGPGGAAVERTSAPADLALGTRELGAAYLGAAGALARLAAAGRVEERTAGALVRASRAFSWDVQPWSPAVW